jgi:ferritin
VQVKDHMKQITSAKIADDDSLAKILFADESEAAINEQINVEYTNCYLYHAMACYFGRDNVALHGFAAYFRDQSDDERGHAQMFMDFLSKRGGRVQLTSISAPPCVRSRPTLHLSCPCAGVLRFTLLEASAAPHAHVVLAGGSLGSANQQVVCSVRQRLVQDFSNEKDGDALHAMNIALALEKLNFEKITALSEVAEKHGDAQFADFIDEMLQVLAISETPAFCLAALCCAGSWIYSTVPDEMLPGARRRCAASALADAASFVYCTCVATVRTSCTLVGCQPGQVFAACCLVWTVPAVDRLDTWQLQCALCSAYLCRALQEQVIEVKDCADMVAQLRRVGKGFPVFEYDKYLTEKMAKADAEAD